MAVTFIQDKSVKLKFDEQVLHCSGPVHFKQPEEQAKHNELFFVW